MFCSKCGTPIPEGCAFCPNCGTKVDQAPQGDSAVVTPEGVPAPKKGSAKWLPWAIVVVVVVVLAVLLKGLLGGSGVKGEFVYLSDGSYYLLKDIAKDPMQFASLRDSDQLFNMVTFSEDGKYIYYFSKADTDTLTGTLCRAQVSKIKKDDSSSASEILDSDVRYYSLRVLSNGDLLYNDGDNSLKFYHDGQAIRISRNTNTFYLSEDESSVVYLEQDEEDSTRYTLYGVKLADPEAPIKLASNVSYIGNADDMDHIFYSAYDEDMTARALYVTDLTGNSEKIADNVSTESYQDGKVYYVAANGTKASLYDYVDDPLAAQDATATEPELDNYEVPYYTYSSLREDDNPNDYAELYTSCTRNLRGLSNGWDGMDDVVEDTSDTYSAATKTAVQSFITKYESKQDEDEYLLVTDEVRNDLKSINATLEDSEDSDWITLCFSKKESGTTTDYDTYREDLDAYRQVENRNELREELQSPDNQIDVEAIYVYNIADKSNTVVQDNILANRLSTSTLLGYRTTDQVTDKIAIQDVSSTYDVQDRVESMDTGTVSLFDLAGGTTVATMSGGDFSDAAQLYLCGDTLLVVNEDSDLLSASISGGTVDTLNVVAENVQIQTCADGETIYYYADTYSDSSDDAFGDYYRYSNGESTLIVRDAPVYNVSLYEDGNALTFSYTGLNDDDMTAYEVNLINDKGESTYLADGVTQTFYLGKNKILYVSDGDLYLYNGKDRERLAEGIDFLWYNGDVEIPQNQ